MWQKTIWKSPKTNKKIKNYWFGDIVASCCYATAPICNMTKKGGKNFVKEPIKCLMETVQEQTTKLNHSMKEPQIKSKYSCHYFPLTSWHEKEDEWKCIEKKKELRRMNLYLKSDVRLSGRWWRRNWFQMPFLCGSAAAAWDEERSRRRFVVVVAGWRHFHGQNRLKRQFHCRRRRLLGCCCCRCRRHWIRTGKFE